MGVETTFCKQQRNLEEFRPLMARQSHAWHLTCRLRLSSRWDLNGVLCMERIAVALFPFQLYPGVTQQALRTGVNLPDSVRSWLSAPEAEPCTSQERKINGHGICDGRTGATKGRIAFSRSSWLKRALTAVGKHLLQPMSRPVCQGGSFHTVNGYLQGKGQVC